jgi:hypothetical protein
MRIAKLLSFILMDSEANKNAANIYANGVPNVFSVTNKLILTGGK